MVLRISEPSAARRSIAVRTVPGPPRRRGTCPADVGSVHEPWLVPARVTSASYLSTRIATMFVRVLLMSVCMLSCAATSGSGAEVPVSLEVVTQPGVAVDGPQQWMQLLQDREFALLHVRIRTAQGNEEPRIENLGTETHRAYLVTGVLTSGGRLALPGLALRYGQRQELTNWLMKLRTGGGEVVTAETSVYGLTARQLAMLQSALKKRVATSTKGRPVVEVVTYLRQTIALDVEWAAGAWTSDDKIQDEFEGLSCGTALAAAVRPHGLLVTPTGQGTRSVGLRIAGDAKPTDAWPVGTRATGGVADLAPALLKFINVEIVDQPLDETLNTIQQRLKIPFLYDHNMLARDEVDLRAKVSMPPRKTFYKKILDELLFQKMLVCELRTDDAGTAFLWITSAKR